MRVLHAEDDDAYADLTAAVLEREEWVASVTRTPDAQAALTELERDDYDCLLSDLEMPGMSGLELYERVRETDPSIPFVLFTGRRSAAARSTAPPAYTKGGTDALRTLAGGLHRLCAAAHSPLSDEVSGRRWTVERPDAMFYRCRWAAGWPAEVVGPGATVLLGYDPEDLEGGELTYADDIVHPDDRAWTHDAMEASLVSGEPFEFTYRVRRADGEVIRVWERGRGVPDGDETDWGTVVEGFVLPLSDE